MAHWVAGSSLAVGMTLNEDLRSCRCIEDRNGLLDTWAKVQDSDNCSQLVWAGRL